MDRLRILYELLNKYALKQDYSDEFTELLRPNIIDSIPEMISLNLVLQIVDMHNFNIEMFNINLNEHFDTDYLDFIATYTQRGFFINFEINQELSIGNPLIGSMTRFSYRAVN